MVSLPLALREPVVEAKHGLDCVTLKKERHAKYIDAYVQHKMKHEDLKDYFLSKKKTEKKNCTLQHK
jgi:hypothetical protein